MRWRIHIREGFYSNSGWGRSSREGTHTLIPHMMLYHRGCAENLHWISFIESLIWYIIKYSTSLRWHLHQYRCVHFFCNCACTVFVFGGACMKRRLEPHVRRFMPPPPLLGHHHPSQVLPQIPHVYVYPLPSPLLRPPSSFPSLLTAAKIQSTVRTNIQTRCKLKSFTDRNIKLAKSTKRKSFVSNISILHWNSLVLWRY